jgi:hypothetical protein
LRCEKASGLCALCQHIGQFNLNGGHEDSFLAAERRGCVQWRVNGLSEFEQIQSSFYASS